jgi:glycosyltransferase involved in cell wall biosynthesis
VLITVILPTFRRPEPLRGALAGLAAQTLPRAGFEVVVVDNDTPPTSGAIVRACADRLDVRLVHEPARGPAAARNAGLQAARARHAAFLDDDCVPAPEWLAALAEATAAHPQALVGGRTLDARPDDLCSAASHLLRERFTARENVDPQAPAFFASNNLAAPVEELRALGGFDRAFARAAGEDRDLCERWRARGLPLVAAPAAIVRHDRAMDVRGLVAQQLGYGRGAFLVHAARRREGRRAARFHEARFYVSLLAAPYRVAAPARATALAALVLLSQAAVAAGYVFEGAAAFAGLKGLRSGG